MSERNNNISNYFLILSKLYLVLMLLCYLFSNKELDYPFHIISTPGMLVLPLAFIIMNMMTELFGYRASRQVFWTSILIQAIFCFLAAGLAFLPGNNPIAGGIPQSHYRQVFSLLPRVFLACFLGLVLGTWLNTKLISKWKVLFKGRYFWLRLIGAAGIGDAVFILLSTFINCFGRFPIITILKFSLGNYAIHLAILALLAPLSNIVLILLKQVTKNSRAIAPQPNPFKKKR